MSELPILSIIVPCFNEEDNIPHTTDRLLEIKDELVKNGKISSDSFIFFVDDGSTDKTFEKIEQERQKYGLSVKAIKFSRNFGNQKAILAGLVESSKYNADCFITIDADLQQDETKIGEFIEKYNAGAKIVCGIRTSRNTDGFFKKYSALSFYKIMNILGVNIKINHSDYRLVSKEVVETLKTFPETNLFLRGIFNELGYKKDYVHFDVKPRKIGETKYTPFSLFSLAISGITSFSLIPLRMVTFIGFLISFASFLIGISAFIDKYIRHNAVPGYATTIVTLAFICGIQILCLGVIAEYLGQLFQEVKARPRYIIEKTID